MGRAGAPARRRCRPSDVLPVFRSSRTERVGGARTGCRGASLKRRMRLAEGNCGAESSGGRPLGDGLNPERRPHEACHRGEPTAPEKTSGAFRSTPPSGRPPRFSRPRTSFALAPPSARSLLGRGSSTSVAHGCAPHSLPSPSSRPGVADSLRKGERKTSCPLRPDGPDCRPVRRTRAACRNLGAKAGGAGGSSEPPGRSRDRHAVGPRGANEKTPEARPSRGRLRTNKTFPIHEKMRSRRPFGVPSRRDSRESSSVRLPSREAL